MQPACLPEACPENMSPQTLLTYQLPASPGLLPLPSLSLAPDPHESLPISQLLSQVRSQPVPQAVLVLNIPDILEGPELHDILEIHFQKPTRGGGEVEALTVVPPGERRLVLFTAVESG